MKPNNIDNTNYTIIIPSKNYSNVIACLSALRAHGENGDVIVVDDSDDAMDNDTMAKLAELGQDRLAFIPGIKPFCFGRNINLGIKSIVPWMVDPGKFPEAYSEVKTKTVVDEEGKFEALTFPAVYRPLDDVVLLNDDAVLETHGGFAALRKAAELNPAYAVIASTVTGYDNLARPLLDSEGRHRHMREFEVRPVRAVPFICVYIPRWTIQNIGVLDPRYYGYAPTAPILCPQCGWGTSGLHADGEPARLEAAPYAAFRCRQCGLEIQVPIEEVYGGEDDDYCYRVRKAGLRVGIFDGCAVNHASLPSSFRPDGRGRSVAGARARFYQIHQIAMGAA
jgi:GT2 family glycosyltransferase